MAEDQWPSFDDVIHPLRIAQFEIVPDERFVPGAALAGMRISANGEPVKILQLVPERIIKRILPGTDLSGVDLSGCEMQHSDLRSVSFENANLHGAQISKINFEQANLRGVDLSEAHINANLNGADLTGANLAGATLEDCSLEGAILHGVDLSGVKLIGTTFSGADVADAVTQDEVPRQEMGVDEIPIMDSPETEYVVPELQEAGTFNDAEYDPVTEAIPSLASTVMDEEVIFEESEAEPEPSEPAAEELKAEFTAEPVSQGSVWLDEVEQSVTIKGKQFILSPVEYAVMAYLFTHAGQDCSSEDLAATIAAQDAHKTIDQLTWSIRKKIERKPYKPQYLKPVQAGGHVVGYRLEVPED